MPSDFWWVVVEAALGTLGAGLLLAAVGLLVRPTHEVLERVDRAARRLLTGGAWLLTIGMALILAFYVRGFAIDFGPDKEDTLETWLVRSGAGFGAPGILLIAVGGLLALPVLVARAGAAWDGRNRR